MVEEESEPHGGSVLYRAGLASEASYPAYKCMRMSNAIGVELFPRKHDYSEGIHGGLIKRSATPMALKRAYQMMIYRFHCENINDNAL